MFYARQKDDDDDVRTIFCVRKRKRGGRSIRNEKHSHQEKDSRTPRNLRMTRAEGLSKSNDVSWVVKGSLLLLLAFQNAALNVFNRYSRVIANDPDSGPGYVKSSLVVVVEFSKIFGSIFLFVIIDCRGDVRDALHRFFQATFRRECYHIAFPRPSLPTPSSLLPCNISSLELDHYCSFFFCGYQIRKRS